MPIDNSQDSGATPSAPGALPTGFDAFLAATAAPASQAPAPAAPVAPVAAPVTPVATQAAPVKPSPSSLVMPAPAAPAPLTQAVSQAPAGNAPATPAKTGPLTGMDAFYAATAKPSQSATGAPMDGQAYGMSLFKSLLQQESGGKQFDASGKPMTSSKGAIGIAQVMPATAPEAARLAGLPWDENRYRNDAAYNQALGTAYYAQQLATFGNDPLKALAAYNAGPGAMLKAQTRAAAAGSPGDWLRFLPQETQNYVPSILAIARKNGFGGAGAPQPGPQASADGYVDPSSGAPLAQKPTLMENIKTGAADMGKAAVTGVGGMLQMATNLGYAATGAKPLKDVADWIGHKDQAIEGTMSPEMQASKGKEWVTSEDPTSADQANVWDWLKSLRPGEALSDPRSWAYQIANQGGSGLLGGFVGKGIGMGGKVLTGLSKFEPALQAAGVAGKTAEKAALASGMEAAEATQAGKAAAQSAFSEAAAKAGVADASLDKVTKQIYGVEFGGQLAEGTYMHGSDAANHAMETIAQMPHSELMQSPKYVQAYQQHINDGEPDDKAQADAKEDMRRAAGLEAAAVTASAALPAQLVMAHVNTKLFRGGMGAQTRLGNFGKALGMETPANAFELGGVAVGSNVGVANYAKPDLPIYEGVANTALSAAVGAGGMAIPHVLSPVQKSVAARPELAPAAAMAAQRNSPLSSATIASNTGAAADAAYAASQAQAQQQQPAGQDATQPAGQTAATAEAPPAAPADPLAARVQAVTEQARASGILGALSSKESPVDAKKFVNDLAIAQSPSTSQALREQALSRLEYAAAWAGDGQAAAVAPTGEQTVPSATDSLPITQQEQDKLTAAAQDGKRTLEDAPRQALISRAMSAIQERGGVASPDEARVVQEANLGQPYDRIDHSLTNDPQQRIIRPGAVATGPVAAPKTPAPSGPGGGTFRKRAATLTQLVNDGLNKVERRHDGNFYLVNHDRRRQFKLDGPADAQLARKAVNDAIHAAASAANGTPTTAQAKAGNYKKGRVEFDGIKLGIENPIGSQRSGIAPDGQPWSVDMSAHYGDVTGTTGKDGDGVDVYLVDHPRAGSPVFVVDQYDGAKFDEHKAILGVSTEAEALAVYDAHFSDGSGPLRRGAVTAMSTQEFKAWSHSPATKQPAGEDHGPARSGDVRGVAERAAADPDIAAGVADARHPDGLSDGGRTRGGRDDPKPGHQGSDAAAAGGAAAGHVTIQVDGQQRSIALVTPTAESDSPKRPGGGREITGPNAAIMDAIGQLFGKQVSFFRDESIGDGFVSPAHPDQVFLNEHSTISPLAVFGHELLHKIADEMPQVHAALTKVVESHLKPGARAAFRQDYSRDQSGNDAPLQAHELNEITSDIGGNLMTDNAFWKDVFDQVQADHPEHSKGLIARMAEQLYRLIDQLLATLKQPNFRSTELVSDLEKVRAAFKDGLAQYVKQAGIGKAGMQAEVLRAGQKAKRSAVRDVTQTETPEFKTWFGDSKVVDAKGRPLVVYHGSTRGGINHNTTQSSFFTSSRDVARTYSEDDYSGSMGNSPVIQEAYLRMTNPLTVAAAGEPWMSIRFDGKRYTTDSLAHEAKRRGHDGLIIRDVTDNVSDEELPPSDIYVTLGGRSQIKSATNNNGNFDPVNADITRSTPRPQQEAYNPAHAGSTATANDSTGGLGREPGALRGADARGDAGVLGDTPSYGAARPGAVSVLGRHYSTRQLSQLNGQYYGRGLKGAERERIMDGDDKRLRQRLHFYIDNGKGIRPEAGVGAHAHEVRLNNLYDPGSKLIPSQKSSNAFESAVIDHGFDGYMIPDHTRDMGAAVLLGKHEGVPVKYIGNPASAAAPSAAAPETLARGLMSKELSAVETGRIPGAQLRNGTLSVPVESREAANDEMIRIGSPVRFSAARESDAPADQYKAVEAKYKGTDQWLKTPAGGATKLNERQWVHVRTPAFKAWFGDFEKAHAEGGVWNDASNSVSKAVGPDGEPLVVYHGTDKGGFTTFREPSGKQRGDLGIFTTSNPAMAESYVRKGRAKAMELIGEPSSLADFKALGYDVSSATMDGKTWYGYTNAEGNETSYRSLDKLLDDLKSDHAENSEPITRPGVYALFANIRNPNESDFEGATWSGERNDQYVVVKDDGEPVYDKTGNAFFHSEEEARAIADENGGEVEAAPEHYESTDSVVHDARRQGNDGAMITSVIDDGGGNSRYGFEPSDVFVAFKPGQLKSADFNNGSYSVSQDDVRFSAKRPARDPAIGDRTDIARLPKGRVVPDSVGVGSLASSREMARAKSYTKGRQLKEDIQARVLAAAKAAKVDLGARNQETFRFLVKMVTADARLALQDNANAVGWYDKTVSRAIGALATVHPEIETDPKSRLAFLWALATTSNGLKVDKNFELAESAYRQWKETGTMPSDVGIGNAASAINKGLALFNELGAKVGDERLFKFMATEFEVGQIGKMLGEAPGGEWMPTPVLGSAILGPKIGNGFFSNLNGYFHALTIDRWLMRTWGRLTGSLIEVDPADVADKRTRLANSISAMNESERKVMARLVNHPVRKALTRAELDALGVAIAKTSMKPEKREIMQSTAAMDEFRNSGNSLTSAIDGQKEAPSGPAERNFMRAVFHQALQELNSGDQAMTMSDLQALLWYPERRLYDAAKSDESVADGYADDEAPDYANAARDLALKNGISQAVIDAAMDKSEQRGTVKGESLSAAEKAAMLKEFRSAPEQAVQLAFEVAPDPADQALTAQWGELSLKDKARITKLVKEAVVDEVVDAVGAKITKTVGATGGFAGMTNPNLITEYKQTQVPIRQARALAASLGMALDQDSVALVDPRASGSAGLIRITLNTKTDKHAAALMAAIQKEVPGIDGFTARGNNFDVLNFTDMSTEEVAGKISAAMDGLDIDAEHAVSFGDTQSELVEKDSYEGHIQGLRPGAGPEILGRIGRTRDRARGIVAEEIRSATAAGLDSRARPGAGRAAAARRADGAARAGNIRQTTARQDEPAGAGTASGRTDADGEGSALRQSDVGTSTRDGRGFTGFFSNISMGFKGRPGGKAYTPILDVSPIASFVKEYNRHRGNFDDHIATSIPGFRELQTMVGSAIAKTYKNADMLDIGASEGALIKAVSRQSGGQVRTLALDPNFAMAKHFRDGERVPGARYETSAFGDKAAEGHEAWTEGEHLTDRDGSKAPNPFAGQTVRYFKPEHKFDVVHEAMVFQFISGDREMQVGRAKELMAPDGVLILEQKFVAGAGLSAEQFRANEVQKDAYKEQYFTKAEIAAKAKAVGVAEKADYQDDQQAKEAVTIGMNNLMASPGELEAVLGKHFKYVTQFWDSGNFKGYLSSDSKPALDKLLANMLPTDSEFSTVSTPRAVSDSIQQSPARLADAERVDLRKRISVLESIRKCLG